MSQNQKNLYEGMFILSSALSEEALKKTLKRVESEITSRGGAIEKIHDMGRKRLAYEIGKHREGHYFLIYFTAPPSAIVEMKSEYRLVEEIVRNMILRTEKILEKVEFPPLVEAS